MCSRRSHIKDPEPGAGQEKCRARASGPLVIRHQACRALGVAEVTAVRPEGLGFRV